MSNEDAFKALVGETHDEAVDRVIRGMEERARFMTEAATELLTLNATKTLSVNQIDRIATAMNGARTANSSLRGMVRAILPEAVIRGMENELNRDPDQGDEDTSQFS
jgi:hypothetical protein